MVRETNINPTKKGTFGTSISFDLDESPAPQRRATRKNSKAEKSDSVENNSSKLTALDAGMN